MNKELENAINDYFTGDAKENALDFTAFLSANDILLESNGDGRGWAVGGIVGNSNGFLMIDTAGGRLAIWINNCDFPGGDSADDDLKAFAWAHVVNCPQEPCVGGGCAEKHHRNVIFGREYDSTCHSPLAFFEPDAETLEGIKKLFLLLS